MLLNPLRCVEKTTKYLLRFDDICPTMNWDIWSPIEALLVAKKLKPILAVVPDNQDPVLRVGSGASSVFWERVRTWQNWGWTIALHGYQHMYVSKNAGLVGLRKKSEFAGLPPAAQEDKLRRGMEIFRREKIQPRTWIAPGNSFDATTVSLLPKFGIQVICDGYFWYPHTCRQGLIWVPQQLFSFRSAPSGVWTVCFHHNQWKNTDMLAFGEDVSRYETDIWSLDEALQRYGSRRSDWGAWLSTRPRLSRFIIHLHLKMWGLPVAKSWLLRRRSISPSLSVFKRGHTHVRN